MYFARKNISFIKIVNNQEQSCNKIRFRYCNGSQNRTKIQNRHRNRYQIKNRDWKQFQNNWSQIWNRNLNRNRNRNRNRNWNRNRNPNWNRYWNQCQIHDNNERKKRLTHIPIKDIGPIGTKIYLKFIQKIRYLSDHNRYRIYFIGSIVH